MQNRGKEKYEVIVRHRSNTEAESPQNKSNELLLLRAHGDNPILRVLVHSQVYKSHFILCKALVYCRS